MIFVGDCGVVVGVGGVWVRVRVGGVITEVERLRLLRLEWRGVDSVSLG